MKSAEYLSCQNRRKAGNLTDALLCRLSLYSKKRVPDLSSSERDRRGIYKSREEQSLSNDEIINSWKNEQHPDYLPIRIRRAKPKRGKKPGELPANPAGEIELSDEDLEAVEGGVPAFIKSLNESCYQICKNDE